MTNDTPKRRCYRFSLRTLLLFVTLFAALVAWTSRPWRTLQGMQGDWQIVSSTAVQPGSVGIFDSHVGEVVSVSGDQFSGIALDHPSYATTKRIVLPMNTWPQAIHLIETQEPHFGSYSGNVRVRGDVLELWIDHPSLSIDTEREREYVVLRRVN
ncbi:MAG: hypothetical protein IIA67_06820 [Planctomycetes bacterium]|nr:hypothetical protein [Planctomycetota bacterium]